MKCSIHHHSDQDAFSAEGKFKSVLFTESDIEQNIESRIIGAKQLGI